MRRGDEGFGSVLVVAGAALLLLAFAGAVAVGDLVATETRVRTAADLSALAAAGAAAYGPGPACSRAAAVAADNHARLQRCTVGTAALGGDATPFDVDVVVAATVTGPAAAVARHLGLEPPVLRARALAGPGRVVAAS